MNGQGDRAQPRRGVRRAAPGSRPSLKAFLPFLILGVVILLALIWIYFIGPAGTGAGRGEALHMGTSATEGGPNDAERLNNPAPRG